MTGCVGVAFARSRSATMTLPKVRSNDASNVILLVDKKPKLTSVPMFVQRAREAIEDEGPPARKPAARAPSKAPSTNKKWAEFEDMGLAKPKPSGGIVAKLVVSMYRLVGFGILTTIVVVLLAYIGMTVFYWFDKS